MSDQQLEPHVQQNDPLGKPDESPDANPAKSIFEVVIDMAQVRPCVTMCYSIACSSVLGICAAAYHVTCAA